jgi:hypothetical protein
VEVPPFVNVRANERHAFILQRGALCVVAEGDRVTSGHGIEPGTGFTGSREQQSATAWQDGGHFRDEPALDFRAEQKEKPACDYAIESPAEEIRVFDGGALNRGGWEVGPEFRGHAGGGIDAIHVTTAGDQGE